MNSIQQTSRELNISVKQVENVSKLLAEGATIPFISRYRKGQTGDLNEVDISSIKEKIDYWDEFIKRKAFIFKTIEEQNQLTAELKNKIETATDIKELEDIYLPFKPKRETKGQKAIKKGLKPLAIFIQKEGFDVRIEEEARSYLKQTSTVKEAIEGAQNILAEWIAEDIRVRESIREQFATYARIITKVKKGKNQEAEKYRDYFDFSEHIQKIPSHRILAAFRGENEGFLSLSIKVDEEKAVELVKRRIAHHYADNTYIAEAEKEAYKRLLQPSFESEFKQELKQRADEAAITVFADNLKQLLLQPPLGGKKMLAIDPGYKTGCKVAILNENGEYIENRTIFPHPPQKQYKEAEGVLRTLVSSHKVKVIAVGDGTAGMETEKLCRKLFQNREVEVYSVNEAGASVYSASSIAREEFPQLDVTVRGTISIGRRLMDPLAELVKIDPKSIGVGQYQHDVNQTALKDKLTEVVEYCVNHVGVDLNTASYPILSYVSGLGPATAKNIVSYREKNGNFEQRGDLLKVEKLGAKTYEQAAGFLRIDGGKNPLDNTIIHPESYPVVKKLAKNLKKPLKELFHLDLDINDPTTEQALEGVDKFTAQLIIQELNRPTRDPRASLKPMERNDISKISDLQVGMELHGKINNITNFGAFVDIGIKESGLVHISELADEFVDNVQDFVSLNQQVKVKVLSVDIDRKRIQLSMKDA
ncbi:MAG: Tex family protein [Crocinitomicaceae bacterium]